MAGGTPRAYPMPIQERRAYQLKVVASGPSFKAFLGSTGRFNHIMVS